MSKPESVEAASPKVYQSLTVQEPTTSRSGQKAKDKWTLYLLLCCITASMSSYIFGFNIGSTNLPTPLIKDFFAQRYFAEESVRLSTLRVKQDEFDRTKNFWVLNDGIYNKHKERIEKATEAKDNDALRTAQNELDELNKEYNGSISEHLERTKEKLNQDEEEIKKLKQPSQKVEEFNTLLWTITTSLFVVGGIVGAFTSKYVQDSFGRKKGILFHHLFTLTGSILVLIAPYINSPECVIISRFIYGVQGGMTCGLIPTYLSEISPNSLRGATGVVHQLFLTIGILTAQTLGFRQLLGTADLWHFLLAIPIVPGVLSSLILLLFFPETPRALLLNNHDEPNARIVLRSLRGTVDQSSVEDEIEEMKREARESKSSEAISLKDLFTLKELRWPLITGIVLQLTQQLCGINAVFFYSESIFKNAGVISEHIQYAIFLTGAVNVLMTIVCVPLIDRLGRKPLLVYPMLMIIVDFIALTVFLNFQSSDKIYSYLCIACIIIFIMSFAIGLGPIPFVYVAESFRQDARSAALAICMFVNWVANLALTVTFPYLARILGNYVFLVFTAIVLAAVIVIFKKVPETKGRSVEEIMAHFEGKKKRSDKDKAATEKLISK